MHRLIASLTCVGLLVGAQPADAKMSFRDRIVTAQLNGGTCHKKLPIFKKISQDAFAARKKRWAADAMALGAQCLAKIGKPKHAIKLLAQAVGLGVDDCFFINTDVEFKKLHGRAKMKRLRRRVKMSPADYAESRWHAAEMGAIITNTNLMIAQNINRKDGGRTVVHLSKLPTRRTRSSTVKMSRNYVRVLQVWMQRMVAKSDRSRLSHLIKMNMIRNMGRGGAVPASVRLRSIRFAQAAAQARLLAIKRRAFRATRLSNRRVSCSSLR